MADRPSYLDDPNLTGPPAAPAPAPAPGGTVAPSYAEDPSLTEPQQQGWLASIVPSLKSVIPGMQPGGWGPQYWQPPKGQETGDVFGSDFGPRPYGAQDVAVNNATFGASDIARGYAKDLTRGALLGGGYNWGQGAQEIKTERDQYAAEHPAAALASGLAGGIATAPLVPGGALFGAASRIANPALRYGATVATGAGLGAGYGALSGAINEAPAGWDKALEGAETGAKWGAGFGAAIPALAPPIGAGARWLGQREWLPAWTQGGREVRGGRELLRDATDPQSVIEAGTQREVDPYTGQNVPGPPEARPSTGQLSGDVGVQGKERDLIAGIVARPESTWSPAERELAQKAQVQGEARTTALRGESPPGADPNNVRVAVQQHLADIDQHNEAIIGQAMTPEGRGADLRVMSEAAKANEKQGAQALYDAVDPDGTLRIDQRGIRADAQQIVREIPQNAKPPEGEEAAIFQRAFMGGSATPFTELTALRTRLLDAIRTEREANGQSVSLGRMTKLRASIDNTLADVAASGADAGTVDRLRAANAAWRQMKETFNNQFVGPLLETRGTPGDYKVPATNVGGKIIANNESAQAFLAAGGDHATLRGALMDDLTRSLKGGEMTPQKLQSWRSTREGAIRAVPGLDAELGNLTTGARTGVVKRVADAGSDTRSNVVSILTGSPLGQTSRNSTSEMVRLKGIVAGNPEAEAGLKSAVIDHIGDRFIDPKTGDIKPGFLRFMQEKRGALEAAVGPDGMRVLDALAADLGRPQLSRADALTSGRGAGAPTGLRAILQQLGASQLGVGGAAAIGSLTHIATQNPYITAAAIGGILAKTMQRHGVANQAELLAQAMNNPALARALMLKATRANVPIIEKAIDAAMAGTRVAPALPYNYSGSPPADTRTYPRPGDTGGGGGDTGEGGEIPARPFDAGGSSAPTARDAAVNAALTQPPLSAPEPRSAVGYFTGPYAKDVVTGEVARKGMEGMTATDIALAFTGGGLGTRAPRGPVAPGGTRVPGVAAEAPAPAGTAKYPQYAEVYPPTGPPVMKVGERGNVYPEKLLTPEAEAFSKERQRIMTDMNKKGYEPYFDPAQRSYVDPSNYPPPNVDTRTVMPKKEQTIANYAVGINAPETAKALRAAYDRGIELGNADHWYAMAQLERKYTDEFGAEVGRRKFLDEFAAPLAATTSGNNPRANLIFAHYMEYLRQRGEPTPAPTEGYTLPYPVGGRRGKANLQDYARMREGGGYEALGAGQPKMHDFSRSMIGDLSRPVMDEQMAGGMLAHTPAGMADKTRTSAYGMLSEPVHDLAATLGIRPGNVQDVAWAGFKNEKGKPMIEEINDAIERTHRLTGMPRDEIVRRALLRKEIPLYGLGALGLTGMAAQQDRGS